jgi:hypothetical protein
MLAAHNLAAPVVVNEGVATTVVKKQPVADADDDAPAVVKKRPAAVEGDGAAPVVKKQRASTAKAKCGAKKVNDKGGPAKKATFAHRVREWVEDGGLKQEKSTQDVHEEEETEEECAVMKQPAGLGKTSEFAGKSTRFHKLKAFDIFAQPRETRVVHIHRCMP